MKQLADVQAAYIAGLVDGEGSICLKTQRGRRRGVMREMTYVTEVSITNTYLDLITWLKSTTGIDNQYLSARGDVGQKDAYRWQVLSADQVEFLTRVLPYLIVKEYRAELLLEYFAECHVGYDDGRTQQPEEVIRLRMVLHSIMADENRRGVVTSQSRRPMTPTGSRERRRKP